MARAFTTLTAVVVAASGLSLTTAGPAAARPTPGSDAKPASVAPLAGGYQIREFFSGRCLAPVNNNTTDRNIVVVLSTAPCGITWNFQKHPSENWYRISLDANGARCLVPSGSSMDIGTRIVTGACGTSNAFYWVAAYYAPSGGRDYYQLWNVNSGWCAAVNNNSTASGAPIIQYVCNDPDAHDIFTW